MKTFVTKWTLIFACILALPGLSSCSAPRTETQKDSSAPISTYKVYRWVGEEEAKTLNLKDPKIDFMASSVKIERRPGIEPQVRNEIEKNLQQNGFRPASAGENADFYITYYIQAKDQNWISTWEGNTPSFNGTPLVLFPGFSRNSAYQYREGTLVLVVYDPKTKQPAWNGSALSILNPNGLDTQRARTEVQHLIQEFKEVA